MVFGLGAAALACYTYIVYAFEKIQSECSLRPAKGTVVVGLPQKATEAWRGGTRLFRSPLSHVVDTWKLVDFQLGIRRLPYPRTHGPMLLAVPRVIALTQSTLHPTK